jgi:hypothetical protein
LENGSLIFARLSQIDVHAMHVISLLFKPAQDDRSVKAARISEYATRHDSTMSFEDWEIGSAA